MATNIGLTVLLFALVLIGSGHTSSSSDPPSPSPSDGGHEVRFVDIDPKDKSSFFLKEEELAKILEHEKCRDLPVSVISIVGDFRKGKSFLLNFILRYLQHAEKTQGKSLGPNWLEELPDSAVTGFGWKGGVDSHTVGLNMWSEPFVLPIKDKKTGHNQDTCVLLMDTQGLFDHQNNMKNTAQLFALSSMMSSVTIYNVLRNLQANDLYNVEIFADYGKLASTHYEDEGHRDEKPTPYQKLVFMIRDWAFPYQYKYGFEDGQKYIDKMFNDTYNDEGDSVKKNIRSYFQSVSGFLMPYPGKNVTKEDFDGRKSTLNPLFVKSVQEFVHQIVSPDRLIKNKTLMGKEMTGLALLEYFKAIFEIFKMPNLPTPMPVLEATSEANNLAASTLAKTHYRREITRYLNKLTKAIDPVELEMVHRKFSRAALKIFDETPKMGQEKDSGVNDAHRQDVINFINGLWKFIEPKNRDAWAARIKGEHEAAISAATEHYINQISERLTKDKNPYLESSVMMKLYNEAIDIYDKAEKVGTPEDDQTYKKSLKDRLLKIQEQNENYLKVSNKVSKWKRKKQMEEMRKQFQEELNQRLKESQNEGSKWMRHQNHWWTLVGGVLGVVSLGLMVG